MIFLKFIYSISFIHKLIYLWSFSSNFVFFEVTTEYKRLSVNFFIGLYVYGSNYCVCSVVRGGLTVRHIPGRFFVRAAIRVWSPYFSLHDNCYEKIL